MNKSPPPDDYDDNPEWTDADFAKARPMTDFPELAAAFPSSKRRGRPIGSTTSEKSRVTLRVDNDVLEAFKAGGPGWQSRINAALRSATIGA